MTDHIARRAARAALWTRLALVAVIVLVVAVASLQLWLTVQLAVQQDEGTERGRKLIALAENVESCTTPGRPCYDRGVEQTGVAIETINLVTLYAAACADQQGVTSLPEIRRCVKQRLSSP